MSTPTDNKRTIAPPTDPRLSLPATAPVRADTWLGEDTTAATPTAPTAAAPPTVPAFDDGLTAPSPSMSAMSATEIIDSGRLGTEIDDTPVVSAFDVEPSGAPLPRRAWDVGTSAIPESPVDDPFPADAEPRPWPGAEDLPNDGLSFPESSMGDDPAPMAPEGWATHDLPVSDLASADPFEPVAEAAPVEQPRTEVPESTFDFDAFDFGGGSDPVAEASVAESAADHGDDAEEKGGRLRNALGGLRRGRNKDTADEAPAPRTATEQIDDPLFAAAVAELETNTDETAFDGEAGFGADDVDATEVTLSEYVDRREATEGDTPVAEEPVFSTTPESFFDQPEPAEPEAADPVMALMADESEVELGRSSRHKLVVAGAGALGVALLGAGVIGMLNRDRFESPALSLGSDDEAPAALALDEPEISVTEQLASGLVRISAADCATATGGGGVLVSATTVVTAAEVTGTSPVVDITLADGGTRVGTLIGIDNQTGLAVINLDRPADGSLAWGATNSIDIGSALAVSSVDGASPVMDATLGAKLVVAAVTTELSLAAELPVQPGGAVINERGEVVAIALADGDVTALVTSDVLRPMVSEFRLDPERFSGC